MLRSILNSRLGVESVLWAGRLFPPRVGFALADLAASLVSRRKTLDPVQAVRLNQFVVHGQKIGAEELDGLVAETFKSAARCIYDFYHWMGRPNELMTRVEVDSSVLEIIRKSQRRDSGTILSISHIANFDLIGRALRLRGLSFQAITPPAPPGGYQFQNRLREEAGMVVTPASFEAVRLATERLRAGGCIITGADRPLPETKFNPCFFGLPSTVPVFHVRLGIKLGLPVHVFVVRQDEKGDYHVSVSKPIEMIPSLDPVEEVLMNAEAILKIIEQNIRFRSVLWNMTYPVWPQISNEVP
jgi:lauroyl/myristoyl acyltransferase